MQDDKYDLLHPGELLNKDFSEHHDKIAFIEKEIAEIYEILSEKRY